MSKDNMTLLSICIPTFNRSSLLNEALTALVDDILTCKGSDILKIEVVISNNASTDNTQQLCEKFSSDYSQINWNLVEQRLSVGADNVQIVTTYAKGRYVLILSDDDIILPGAVNSILEHIKSGCDIFIINHTSFDTDIIFQTLPHFSESEDKIFSDVSGVIEYLGTMITFLSIICFRTDLVDTHAYSFAFGSNLPQSYMFIDAILGSKSRKLIASPVLSARRNNTGGYNVFSVFIEKFFALLGYGAQKGIDEMVISKVKSSHLIKFLLPLVVLMKTSGVGVLMPDWTSTKQLFGKYYGHSAAYWLLVAPIVYAPAKTVHILANMRKLVKGVK